MMVKNNNSELITPFAETTNPIIGSFIDVTLTIKTTYGKIDHKGYRFFRHGGIEFWWTSNNPTVAIMGLTIDYQTIGKPYRVNGKEYQHHTSFRVDNVPDDSGM